MKNSFVPSGKRNCGGNCIRPSHRDTAFKGKLKRLVKNVREFFEEFYEALIDRDTWFIKR